MPLGPSGPSVAAVTADAMQGLAETLEIPGVVVTLRQLSALHSWLSLFEDRLPPDSGGMSLKDHVAPELHGLVRYLRDALHSGSAAAASFALCRKEWEIAADPLRKQLLAASDLLRLQAGASPSDCHGPACRAWALLHSLAVWKTSEVSTNHISVESTLKAGNLKVACQRPPQTSVHETTINHLLAVLFCRLSQTSSPCLHRYFPRRRRLGCPRKARRPGWVMLTSRMTSRMRCPWQFGEYMVQHQHALLWSATPAPFRTCGGQPARIVLIVGVDVFVEVDSVGAHGKMSGSWQQAKCLRASPTLVQIMHRLRSCCGPGTVDQSTGSTRKKLPFLCGLLFYSFSSPAKHPKHSQAPTSCSPINPESTPRMPTARVEPTPRVMNLVGVLAVFRLAQCRVSQLQRSKHLMFMTCSVG